MKRKTHQIVFVTWTLSRIISYRQIPDSWRKDSHWGLWSLYCSERNTRRKLRFKGFGVGSGSCYVGIEKKHKERVEMEQDTRFSTRLDLRSLLPNILEYLLLGYLDVSTHRLNRLRSTILKSVNFWTIPHHSCNLALAHRPAIRFIKTLSILSWRPFSHPVRLRFPTRVSVPWKYHETLHDWWPHLTYPVPFFSRGCTQST